MRHKKLRLRSPSGLMALKPYLDEINDHVERPGYIIDDPVQFIHAFDEKRNQEIAGFLASTMAWGRRDIVISKVENLLQRMDYNPFQFVMNYSQSHFDKLVTFKHRTFKPVDIHGIIIGLQKIYSTYSDFESFWSKCQSQSELKGRPLMAIFHETFFGLTTELPNRTRKHISNPEKGSTCKRLYMYLRWMIRKNSDVDPGIWNFIPPSDLLIPFDVHVSRQARKYGLVSRKSNDFKTVIQLTDTLRILDADDPARYDYALFGIGALGYSLPSKFILNRL